MKVVFVSNILSNHNVSICEEIVNQVDEFWFIATENSTQEGFLSAKTESYVLHYMSDRQRIVCENVIVNADMVIFGQGPKELLELRMKTDKLTFLYSERLFKLGVWRRFIPFTYKKIRNQLLKYKNMNFYVLCASAYLPYDLSLLKYPTAKCYKWGYFPEVKQHDVKTLFSQKKQKEKIVILWAGRLVKLKHADCTICVAERLKREGYKFELQIIGSGELEKKLCEMIHEKGLDDCIKMLGYMSSELVRKHMDLADIYLFTSDFREGWGAVLNESMNSACAVVASHAIGSVPFLIEEQKNGLIYQNDNIDELYHKVKLLLESPQMREELGKNAHRTICEEWNAHNAVKKLLLLSEKITHGVLYPQIYEQGVCSRAKVLKNDWFVEERKDLW